MVQKKTLIYRENPYLVTKNQIQEFFKTLMYKIYKNKVFNTKIGRLVKFTSKDSKFFKKFGEVYFNVIKRSKKRK